MSSSLKIALSQKHPLGLLKSLQAIDFVCPQCRGHLQIRTDGYECTSCKKNYKLHAGIPDFRVFPDPFLSYKEDYERTEIILQEIENLEFEKLLEYYWSFSDITPAALRPRFIKSALLGEHRASRILDILAGKVNKPIKKVLEIGSGTGNFLAVSNYPNIIGIDVAMRWLHVSRRRFMDAGIEVPPLVCCNAEALPFADETFDLIVASSTLEFVRDQERVFAECSRTLQKEGILFLNSVNRFSIARDPYSYLWGIGFLPRKWQPVYVKWRRDASYENIRTLSYRDFYNLADKYFTKKEFALPDVASSVLKEFSLGMRFQIGLYQMLKRLPAFKFLLKRFGPSWDIILQTDAKD